VNGESYGYGEFDIYGNAEVITPEDEGVINRWKSAVADFERQYQRHMDNWAKARDVGETAQWELHANEMGRTQAAIDTIADQLSQISGWTKSVFGLSALKAIPLIPIAAIIGSISAVVAVTYSVSSYNDELERRWQFVKANPGMSPAEVNKLIGEGSAFTALASPLGEVKGLIAWIVIGGAIIMFLPGLLKGKS